MFFSLLIQASLSIVKKTDYEEAIKYTKRMGKTFVLAIDSDSYQYPLILHTYTSAAHASGVEANFIIVDTYETDITPEMFNATQFPCLSFYQDAKFLKAHYTHFGEEFVMSFINSNNFKPIPYIASEEGLKKFKETAALGFIAAIDTPSKHISDFMNTMHREHFNEITVAYAHPSVFYNSGFYLFRFEDQTMYELGDIESLETEQIMQIIVDKSVPFTHHLGGDIANYFYNEHVPYMALVYDYKGFYLNEDSAREAEAISNECELNVTYAKQGVNPVPQQLGMSSSKKPQLCIIDETKKYRKHYCVDDEVSVESAGELCRKWRQGKAKKLWRSDRKGRKAKTEITPINAYELEDEIMKGGKLVIGIYYSEDNCLKSLKDIAKEMSGSSVKFFEFSIETNDWSGDEEVDMSPLPRLVVYNHGRLLLQTQLSNDTQVAYDQVTHAFYKSKQEKEQEDMMDEGVVTVKKVENDGTIDINAKPIKVPADSINVGDNEETKVVVDGKEVNVKKVVEGKDPITVKEAEEKAKKAKEEELHSKEL